MEKKISVIIALFAVFMLVSSASADITLGETVTGTDDIHWEDGTAVFTEAIVDQNIIITKNSCIIDGRAYTNRNVTFILENVTSITLINVNVNNLQGTEIGAKDGIQLTNTEAVTATNSTVTGAHKAVTATGGTATKIVKVDLTGNAIGLSVTNLLNQAIVETEATVYLCNFVNIQNVEANIISGGAPATLSFSNGTHGNYWSTYQGVDANIDGIGDTPHTITETLSDPKPLMTQYPVTLIPEFTLTSLLLAITLTAAAAIIAKKRLEVNKNKQ